MVAGHCEAFRSNPPADTEAVELLTVPLDVLEDVCRSVHARPPNKQAHCFNQPPFLYLYVHDTTAKWHISTNECKVPSCRFCHSYTSTVCTTGLQLQGQWRAPKTGSAVTSTGAHIHTATAKQRQLKGLYFHSNLSIRQDLQDEGILVTASSK